MQPYEEYLRAPGLAIDTEVNLQLGEYTLKNHTLQALSPSTPTCPTSQTSLARAITLTPIQCVEVNH